ncbi:MAG: C4-type zinc ribbon domain-containing protein [Armatimonadota bacterium]|nr:C4-type zinc ribbon domain-containing protein [Armatimonadota bacterium]MDR7518773.1 C4-type zinc ribbon domain-containing protein [Armatimonadota bacterium]
MSVSRLFELQQIDLALARAIAQRQALDDGSGAQAAARAAAEFLAGLQQQIAEGQGRLRTLDLEIKSVEAKRTKVERELYSGRIGNPKELTAMQEEVAALRRHQGRLEDEVLALMERAEHLEAQVREARRQLEEAEADLARRVEAFRQAAEASDREIADLAARREALAEGLDEDLLRRYTRLRDQKGGIAVVAVRHGVCGGCHVVIPQRLLSRLERDPELLAACDGCGRLLVVRPET